MTLIVMICLKWKPALIIGIQKSLNAEPWSHQDIVNIEKQSQNDFKYYTVHKKKKELFYEIAGQAFFPDHIFTQEVGD